MRLDKALELTGYARWEMAPWYVKDGEIAIYSVETNKLYGNGQISASNLFLNFQPHHLKDCACTKCKGLPVSELCYERVYPPCPECDTGYIKAALNLLKGFTTEELTDGTVQVYRQKEGCTPEPEFKVGDEVDYIEKAGEVLSGGGEILSVGNFFVRVKWNNGTTCAEFKNVIKKI